MKILLVDDQPNELAGPYYILNQLGHETTIAFDGAQAFKEVQSAEFNLIILDWNMPHMSGEDFLKITEQTSLLMNGPLIKPQIIVYTGQQIGIEEIQHSLNYNLLDVWYKPLSAIDFLKKIKHITNRIDAA